jgi:hypothetical protein
VTVWNTRTFLVCNIMRQEEFNHFCGAYVCRHVYMMGSLDPAKVKGKIVVCTRGVMPRVEKGEAVRRAGGAGMIVVNNRVSGDDLHPDPHVLPAVHITYAQGQKLLAYINSTK